MHNPLLYSTRVLTRLKDTMETYFDSHLDLLQRQLAKTSDRLKMRAEERLNDIKKEVLKDSVLKIMPTSNVQLERELQRYKLKVRTCAPRGPTLFRISTTWLS